MKPAGGVGTVSETGASKSVWSITDTPDGICWSVTIDDPGVGEGPDRVAEEGFDELVWPAEADLLSDEQAVAHAASARMTNASKIFGLLRGSEFALIQSPCNVMDPTG